MNARDAGRPTFNYFLGLVSFAIHHAVILAEEAHLRSTLGEGYLDYQRTVRRYL